MTAFRRKGRPGIWIQPQLPKPWGRVGQWQTGARTMAQARQVEAWLQDMAVERPQVIDGILERRWSLREAWIAHRRGKLDELLSGATDPLLAEAIDAYRPVCRDDRARRGLDMVLEWAPAGARLSWLDRRSIPTLYARALDAGQKPNTVRRGLHRGVSELLRFHLGSRGRDAAFEDVAVPGGDDTRDVRVTPAEVQRLVEACQPDRFRWMVIVAIATTADRKPLLDLRVDHFDEANGVLLIPDRKARARWRKVRLSGPAMTALRLATEGKGRTESVFGMTHHQVRRMWDAARAAAKLPDLRFKDLRHLLPSALAAAKVDRREIRALLGHAHDSKMTDRYITPAGDVTTLDAAAEALGLSGVHVRRVG